MTLPLPVIDWAPAQTVRCRACQRVCRHRTWDGYGPECARRRGLIPARRAAVVSGAAGQPLCEINEGDAMSDTYVHKPLRVAAIKWTGDNFVEVKQFIYDWIGDQDATGVRTDPDDEYRVLQFYAWNDDQEVDPGRWIVVHRDDPIHDRGEVMYDDDFALTYEAEVS